MSDHATLSPSSAHRWMACPGSLLLESQLPRTTNAYAEEGSAAHAVAALVLEPGVQGAALRHAGDYVGAFYDPGTKNLRMGGLSSDAMVEITEDMATDIQVYVDAVRTYAAGNELQVERRVDVSQYLGVPNQFGTSDAIILPEGEVQVHDLKFGRGVRVDAEHNPQAMLYALGAYAEASLFDDIKRVRIVIHQPRLKHLSEWDCTPAELLEFADRAKTAAVKAIDILETGIYDLNDLVAGDEQCKFCKAKAICPKLQTVVQQSVGASFEDLTKDAVDVRHVDFTKPDNLATCMAVTDLIEGWCKAVRAEVERRLLAREAVGDYKLVRGKKGNRAWVDAGDVEKKLRDMRLKLDEMYEFKLLSPTKLEKRLTPWTDAEGQTREPVLGPRQWPKIKELVVQAEGGLSVAPGNDPRPAVVVAEVVFDAVEDDAGGLL